jgi:mannose-6-phosphate isomerase-like protein (cupin superfamily)
MKTYEVKKERRFSGEKMQKVNLFETERMFCDIYCLGPGQEQKVHAHAGADKIYFVLEGTARVSVGGEERDLKADEIVLAPSGVEHGVRNASGEPALVLVFMAPNPNKKITGGE